MMPGGGDCLHEALLAFVLFLSAAIGFFKRKSKRLKVSWLKSENRGARKAQRSFYASGKENTTVKG